MTRVIRGLSELAYDRLKENLPNIFSKTSEVKNGIVDVTLNEYVIIKAYDDSVMFDLGGHLEFIGADDFMYINIS